MEHESSEGREKKPIRVVTVISSIVIRTTPARYLLVVVQILFVSLLGKKLNAQNEVLMTELIILSVILSDDQN